MHLSAARVSSRAAVACRAAMVRRRRPEAERKQPHGKGAVESGYLVKQTGFPKDEPVSLYCRDSPWISSYHIQNSFQSNTTDITHVYNITWVCLLHNPRDCNTNLRIQAPWAKRKQTESENDI